MAENNIIENIAFWVVLITAFFIPIFFLPVSFISVQFGTSLFFSFCVISAACLYVISSLKKGALSFPENSKTFLATIFIVPFFYVLSGLSKGLSVQSFFGYTLDINSIGFIILSFTYLLLISQIFKSKQKIFYSYFAFLLSAVVTAIYLVSRIIIGSKFLSFGIFNQLTQTPISSWNSTGIYFGVCLLLSMITFELAPISKVMKIFTSVSILISTFFLVLVNFKVIWLIVGVSSFLFILYSMFNKEEYMPVPIKKRLGRITFFPLFILIVCIYFFVWGGGTSTYLSTKAGVTNIEIRPSLQITYYIAKNTISQSPLFGTGPNTFINNWFLWKPQDLMGTIYWNLNFNNGVGLLPTYIITTGILGLLSWAVFLLFYIKLGLKTVFRWQNDGLVKYLAVSSFFASFYLWIMALVYDPTIVVYILTFFFTGVFFASATLSGEIRLKQVSFLVSSKKGFFATLFLVSVLGSLVFFGFGIYKITRSFWYFQKSYEALNTKKDVDLSEKFMFRAVDLAPYDIYYRALAEIELAKLNLIAGNKVSKEEQEEIQNKFANTLTSAIKAGATARDIDPNNYMNWIGLGSVYDAVSSPNLKIKGAYSGAQSAYEEALKRNPKNPAILLMLSRLNAAQNDLSRARDYAIQAIKIKNNYLDAYFMLSQIEVSAGNISGAIEATLASISIDRTNPALYFQLGLLRYNQSDWRGAINAFQYATSLVSDYANAKYFLGLSYERVGEHSKAIKEFQDLKVSNPNSSEVSVILDNLLSGKSIFTNSDNKKPEKGKSLPIKEVNG